MAYLDPQNLTCKSCGQAGDLVWVVGVGPHTKKGDPPSYVNVTKPGPWVIKDVGKTTQVYCPKCHTLVEERCA